MRAPAQIDWLVAAVGESGALAFIESVGGQRLAIPKAASGSRLEALYGGEIAAALCARFSGEKYDVPVMRKWRIHLYAAMGLTVNDIAARAGVAVDTVYRTLRTPYLGEMAKRPVLVDDRQASLF